MFYTIGQRFPLKKSLRKNAKPWFIFKKEKESNSLIACQGNFNLHLFKKEILIKIIYWISIFYNLKFSYQAKIRYQSNFIKCSIYFINERVFIKFMKRQRAVTPGQSIVFYKKNICLGSGYIEE